MPNGLIREGDEPLPCLPDLLLRHGAEPGIETRRADAIPCCHSAFDATLPRYRNPATGRLAPSIPWREAGDSLSSATE
jgi:hypothetical protein